MDLEKEKDLTWIAREGLKVGRGPGAKRGGGTQAPAWRGAAM
jgi:hypothetical protein